MPKTAGNRVSLFRAAEPVHEDPPLGHSPRRWVPPAPLDCRPWVRSAPKVRAASTSAGAYPRPSSAISPAPTGSPPPAGSVPAASARRPSAVFPRPRVPSASSRALYPAREAAQSAPPPAARRCGFRKTASAPEGPVPRRPLAVALPVPAPARSLLRSTPCAFGRRYPCCPSPAHKRRRSPRAHRPYAHPARLPLALQRQSLCP